MRFRFFLLTILAPGVHGSEDPTNDKPPPPKLSKKHNSCSIGLVQVESTRSFEDTYSAILQVLSSNINVYIAAEFDAAKVASVVNVTGIPPNRVVIFGNPVIAAPLIAADQASALDLPQKMHVYQTMEGKVMLGYNTPKYLEKRYTEMDKKAQEDLDLVNAGLRTLAADAAGVDPSTISDKVFKGAGKDMFSPKYRAGIYKRESNVDFATTLTRLVAMISNKGLYLVDTVDHQAASASVGVEIRPTTLIMFCFPPFDATFMQSNQCAVADFPLKMLLMEAEDGTVEVRMNNFNYLRQRHHIHSGSINEDVYNYVQNVVLEIVEGATV